MGQLQTKAGTSENVWYFLDALERCEEVLMIDNSDNGAEQIITKDAARDLLRWNEDKVKWAFSGYEGDQMVMMYNGDGPPYP